MNQTTLLQQQNNNAPDSGKRRLDGDTGGGDDRKRPRTGLLVESLTTPRRPSLLADGTFTERVDPAVLDKLLRSDVLRRQSSDDRGEVWELLELLHLTDEGVHLTKLQDAGGRVTYKTTTGYGRVYATRGLSLALLRKRVRHTLCQGVYIDWDMVNAQPVILLELLRRNRPDEPELWISLNEYCQNRKDVLDSVVATHGVSPGYAKTLFVAIINGGTYANWKLRAWHRECCGGKGTCAKRYKKTDPRLGERASVPLVVKFEAEMRKVVAVVCQENPALVAVVKAQKEENGKEFDQRRHVMSVYLGNFERILVETAIEFFRSKGAIVGNDCIQAYDGMMTPAALIDDESSIPQILLDLGAHVKAETGFGTEWLTKPFDRPYTEEELAPFVFEHTGTWSHEYMHGLEGYDRKKRYFELFFTKIEKPECRYVRADKSYRRDREGNENCDSHKAGRVPRRPSPPCWTRRGLRSNT